MNRCRIVIVADDLTGALDAAAPFAARGAHTRVFVALEHLDEYLKECLEAWREDCPPVIAVNTESRHLSEREAAARVAEASRLLARLAPSVWFKKIDSTLRGQVLAESLAMTRATGRRLLLAPAVPAQGRGVRDAEVWVEGVPLARTAYGADARSRPLIGPLDIAFTAAGAAMQRWRAAPGRDLPAEHCVADTSTSQELAYLYDAVSRQPEAWLLVGAAGLAAAVAQRCFGLMRGPLMSLGDVSHCLYALGSRSPRALVQYQRLRQGAPELKPEAALDAPLATGASSLRLLVPGATDGAYDPAEVARAMGERVATTVAAWPPSVVKLLFLTGGDIAMAALGCLGARFIDVATEWEPGVVLGVLDGDPRCHVMTKAGGFGDPGLLLRLHREVGVGAAGT
ncbi:four-carbon acid sugar kinase family protein [Billgrantia sp. Q4P2]|uniref:four-carbon acid sugar kinase family protein n=1 Tax=Billgrantia sp. Q4P2 TaxID=3463857 RepID=UPI004056B82F